MANQDPNVLRGAIDEIFDRHNRTLDIPGGIATRVPKGIQKQELELAVAVLLVDLARADQNFDRREYNTICVGLKRLFGTSPQEVTALIHKATLALSGLRGVNKFGDLLRESLKPEERAKIMEIIDEVIKADGTEDGFETYLRAKFADLLAIEPENTGEKE